jgi:hypothetical protein
VPVPVCVPVPELKWFRNKTLIGHGHGHAHGHVNWVTQEVYSSDKNSMGLFCVKRDEGKGFGDDLFQLMDEVAMV